MNLPDVIHELVKTQNNHDHIAFADCFTESAIVSDEGKAYKGKKAISEWIGEANRKFKTRMKPIGYSDNHILKAEVSGNFPGSPITLSYVLHSKTI